MNSEEQKASLPKEYMVLFIYRVIMRTATWTRDSHGLFDYESTHVIRKNIKINEPCLIIRAGNDVRQVQTKEATTSGNLSETVHLMELKTTRSKMPYSHLEDASAYCIATCAKGDAYDDAQDKLWLSIRNAIDEEKKSIPKPYKLEKGDIVKLGRIKFKIKDYRIEASQASKVELFRFTC